MSLIYTLGSSNRSQDEFLELLGAYGIEVLLDVRRFPTSKFDQFQQENLQGAVEAAGIQYVHLGKELGGYRPGGYPRYMESPAFLEGLQALLANLRGRRGCILCAERLPWKCHRRFIARALTELGWEAVHILEKDRVWREGLG
ncbi:MAG: DUF488 domain-containing protein [candidate division NC10 bacterium]|nr:DUF488 domain-containing protein [candidate division NC10 bacterium]